MARLIRWFARHRESSRTAFLMTLGVRVANAALSLIWVPLLLSAMGAASYGVFISFTAIAAFVGLSDLGIGGTVALILGQKLGRNEEHQATEVLSEARGLLVALALALTALVFALSPWLPSWLGFRGPPEFGDMSLLFIVAGFCIPLAIFGNYFAGVNYGCGNVTWPVLPIFLVGQGAPLGHWLLAKAGMPIWLQYLPYALSSIGVVLVYWYCLRLSHPQFAALRPLRYGGTRWMSLSAQSFWFYSWNLACAVYMATDRLIINAAFGAEQVPQYHLNYKACELLMWIVVSAGLVSMPKITMGLASEDTKARAILQAEKLQKIQVLFSIAAAISYLLFNDWFVAWWIGESFRAPIGLQIAFAANLAITGAGDCGSQIAVRSGELGLRVAGRAVLTTALLNVVLSLLAVQYGTVVGVAYATVVAQLLLVTRLVRFSAATLGLSIRIWLLRSCALPIGAVAIIGGLRISMTVALPGQFFLLVAISVLLIIGAAALLGINVSFLKEEWRLMRGLFFHKSQ